MFNRRCRYEYGKPYVHPSIEAAKTSREDNTPLLFGMFRAPLRLRKAPRPKSPPLSKNRGSTADTKMIREPVLRCLSPPSIRCVKGIFPSEPWKTREVFSAGTTEWSSGTTFSILPQLLSRPESSTESVQQRKPPPTERSATTGARQSCITDDVSPKTVTDDVSAVTDDVSAVTDDVSAVVDDVSAAIDDPSADVSAKTVVDDVITVPYDDNVSVQIERLDAEAEQTVGGTEASIILTSASVSQVTTRPELEGDKETPLEQDGEQQKHTIDPAQSKRSGSAGKRTEGSSGRKAGYEGDDETSAWESYESVEVSIASQRSSAASVEAAASVAASVKAASRNASSCSILSACSQREANGVESGPEGDTSRVDTSQDKDTSSQDKDTSSPEMSISGRETGRTSSELPVAYEIRDGYFDETSRRESFEEFMSRRHSVGDPEDPAVIKESHFDEHMRRRSYEEYIMRRMSQENAIWKTYSYISKPLDNIVESDNSDSVDSSRGFSFPFFIPRSCTSASQFVKRSGYPSRRSVIDGKAEKVSAVKLVKRKRHTTVSDIVKACDRMYINDILSRQLYHGNLFWARMAGVTTDETLRRKNLKVRIVTSGYEPFFPGGKFKESVTNLDRKRSKQLESSERKSISDQASLQDQNKATRSSVDRSSFNDEFRRRSSATGQSQEISEISDQLLLDQIAIKMQSSVDQSDTTADLWNQSPIQQPFTAEQSDKQTADLGDQSSIQQPFTAEQSDKPPELFDQSSREQPPAAEQSDKPTAEMSDRSSTKRQSTTEQSFSRNEADEQICSGPQSFDDKESSASPEPTHLTSLSKPMAVSDFPPLNPLYFSEKRRSLPVPLIHLKHPAGRPRSLSTPLALYQNHRGQTMPGELDPSEVRGESSRTPGVLKYTQRESEQQSYVVEEFHSPRPPASTPEPMAMKSYTPFVAGFKYWNRWISNVAKEPGAYCGNAFLELSVPRPTSPVLWKYDRVNRV